MQAPLEVVSPTAVRNVGVIITGIHRWESRVAASKSECSEELPDLMKLAILIGMLPKEYQVLTMQTSVVKEEKMKYETPLDHVLMVATQRVHMAKLGPMDCRNLEQ